MDINNNNIDDDRNKTIKNIVIKFIIIIYILTFSIQGIMFLIVGLIANINEKQMSKDYIETTGVLDEYEFVNENTGYKGIYKYTVDNKDYYVSPNRITKKSDYKPTEVVRYNPENPSEAIIYADWSFNIIGGVIIIGITLIILICILVKRNKV